MKEQHPDNEGFLGRWSRLKKENNEPEATQESQAPAESGPASEPASNAAREESPKETRTLTDEDMPPLETLDENSDYSAFLSPGVSEELRRLAMRKLFSAPQFNVRDGLDDYDEDYTQFARLDPGVITADMKYMMEVEAKRTQETLSARQAALDSVQDFTASPTGMVEYRSQGRILVIGGKEALFCAAQMQAPLQPHIVLTEDSELARGKSVITQLHGRSLSLNGWLGAFHLELAGGSGGSLLEADLVLDLCETPLFQRQIQPPGYYHLAANSLDSELPPLLETLAELSGSFAKPKFFSYDANTCAHSRSGLPGCNRCIEACPAEAIISIGESIRVEPHLCQGGGTCATVCPSGAIRYNYPPPSFHVDQLRRMLKAYREAGGSNPAILFYRGERELDMDTLPAHILPVALEELASVGAEVWSSALSFGASQVLLLDEPSTPALARQTLLQQLEIMHALLGAMGYPAEAVALVTELPTSSRRIMPTFTPATQSGSDNKRQQWILALEHLHAHASQQVEAIPLPAGAPFGRLQINQDTCTLCMACATICPAQAISGGIERPELRFYAGNCVQCGLCANGCPEQSITLEPVFLTGREQRQKAAVLHAESPFHCIACGKPFASQTIILKMLEKLAGHYMFQDERARRRLEMCEDCRVVDIVQDEAAMEQPGLGENPSLH